jgi:hypothetical protein
MYAIARSIGNPVFDMRELKDDAFAALKFAKKGARTIDPDTEKVLKSILLLPDKLTSVRIKGRGGAFEEIRGEEILSDLRTSLYQISHPQPGQPFRTTDAMKFASELSEKAWVAFYNPINIDQLPGYRKAWTDAADMATERFKQIELFDALVALRTREFNPMAVAQRMFSASGGGDTIVRELYRALRDQGLSSRWKPIQEGFRSEMIRTAILDGADAAIHTLNRFQPRTLARLMGTSELKDFRAGLAEWSKLTSLGIKDKIKKQTSDANMVLSIVASGNRDAMKALLRSAPPGSDLRRSIQAGLLDKLVTLTDPINVPGRLQGKRMLNPEKVYDMMEKLREMDADQFIEPENIEFVRGLINYMYQTGTGLDFSAGLAGGSAAGQIGSIVTEPKSAIMTMLHTGMLGRVLASNTRWGRSLLVGLWPGEKHGPTFMRTFGAMAADVAKTLEEENQRKNVSSIPRPILRRMGLEQ